jgi:hypothetical protein
MTCAKKEGERDHLPRWIAKMEAITSICARGKVAHEDYAKSAHGGTPW